MNCLLDALTAASKSLPHPAIIIPASDTHQMLVLTSPMFSQTSDINQLVTDPKRRDEVIAALSGNHELHMKLIDKLSEHPHFAQMTRERFGGAAHPAERSDYLGQEARSIKAWSGEQIQQYVDGE